MGGMGTAVQGFLQFRELGFEGRVSEPGFRGFVSQAVFVGRTFGFLSCFGSTVWRRIASLTTKRSAPLPVSHLCLFEV